MNTSRATDTRSRALLQISLACTLLLTGFAMLLSRFIIVVFHTTVADIISITSTYETVNVFYLITTSIIPGMVFKFIIYKYDIERHVIFILTVVCTTHYSIAAVSLTTVYNQYIELLLNTIQSISTAIYNIYFIDTYKVDGKYIFSIVYNARSAFIIFDNHLLMELSVCTLIASLCVLYIILDKHFTPILNNVNAIYIIPDVESAFDVCNTNVRPTIKDCLLKIILTPDEYVCIVNDSISLMIVYTLGPIISINTNAYAIYYIMCVISVILYPQCMKKNRMNKYFILLRFCASFLIFKSTTPAIEIFSAFHGFTYYLNNNKNKDDVISCNRYRVLKSILIDAYTLILLFILLYTIYY